jgi:hypothetical protein
VFVTPAPGSAAATGVVVDDDLLGNENIIKKFFRKVREHCKGCNVHLKGTALEVTLFGDSGDTHTNRPVTRGLAVPNEGRCQLPECTDSFLLKILHF